MNVKNISSLSFNNERLTGASFLFLSFVFSQIRLTHSIVNILFVCELIS